ncbi:hypothetical protein AQUCO_06400050v1 [Aquilegia coerulea]|uniref:Uncharacterized protein n=1 Tax=Aquilegia coerulea TaxID=218851 RepID=A0A2G5CCK6_AQUCA|nr:hypothetical protein AQUCO_06400050v1 [Aquilegia coerulea]
MNFVDTNVYNSTQFFRFGSSIYDLSFMDVDKILPFSSTLGWHSLKVNGGQAKAKAKAIPVVAASEMGAA